MSDIRTKIREDVDRGALLLDVIRPGWFDVIDIETLNIQYPHLCVIGQLYGEFSSTMDDWRYEEDGFADHATSWTIEDAGKYPGKYGFNDRHHHPSHKQAYKVHTEEWIRLITSRRQSSEVSNG
ncbi:MAG: hypothetical protein AAFV53_31430 [Myxococcota bacterium]